jgi:uncharacterized protein YoxC
MDPFIIFIIFILSIITIILAIVGVYIILVLRNVNKSLAKLNQTFDVVDSLAHHLTHPLNDIGSLTRGVRTGIEVAEYTVSWLKSRQKDEQPAHK